MHFSLHKTQGYENSNSTDAVLPYLQTKHSVHIPLIRFCLWQTVMTSLYRTEALWEQHNKREDETFFITKRTNANSRIAHKKKGISAKECRPILNGTYSVRGDSCKSHNLPVPAAFGSQRGGFAKSNELNVQLTNRSTCRQVHKERDTDKAWILIRQMKRDKNPKCVRISLPLSVPPGCRVNLSGLCVRLCSETATNRDGSVQPAPLRRTTTGHRFWIIYHIHYGTSHEYKRGRRVRRKQEAAVRPHRPYLPHHLIS